MSFSIVDSKVKNYTKPIYDLVINREQQVVPCQSQQLPQVFQEQKVQTQTISQTQSVPQTQTVNQTPFLLEKRKPFQLKSRDRFQARRTMSQPVFQPEPPVIVQPLPQPVLEPVPLVQIPTTQSSTTENQEFDEFGYSIDDI